MLNPLRRFRDRLLRPVVGRLDGLRDDQRTLLAQQRTLQRNVAALAGDVGAVRHLLAPIAAENARLAGSLREAELKAYSQFGEDGVIQWLLARVPMASRSFVEFGVADYRESNTRFLLEHFGWSGLIMDSGTAHVRFVQESGLAWRGMIEARSTFITAENINGLLADQPSDLGLLSVDVDGMDYWILSAIAAIRPRIVVCEYNSLLGPAEPVSVPYDPTFTRRAVSHSMLYFGASISALAHWAARTGYRLVGSTSQGVNAFLVREDVAGDLPSLSGPEAWVETPVRQARDENGELTYLGGLQPQRQLIAALPLVDVVSGATLLVGDLEAP